MDLNRKLMDIELEIMSAITSELPATLRLFWPTERPKMLEKRHEMKRWERVQVDVGWLAVAFSQSFPVAAFTRYSHTEFDNFLDCLKMFRAEMIKPLEVIWPKYPRLLTQSGGNLSSSMSADRSLEQGWDWSDVSTFRPSGEPEPYQPAQDSHSREPSPQPRRNKANPAPTKDIRKGIKRSLNRELPIWKWKDNSCSLDATALIPLLYFIECPTAAIDATGNQSSVPQEFRTVIGASSGYDGPWELWDWQNLTKLRDLIRENLTWPPFSGQDTEGKLRDGTKQEINGNSSVDSLIQRFAPPEFTSVRTVTTFKCERPGCVTKSVNAGKETDGYYFCYHSRNPMSDGITFNGPLQKDCNTQDLMDLLVFPKSYKLSLI